MVEEKKLETEMEEENIKSAIEKEYCGWKVMSPEIVEIGEDSLNIMGSRDGGTKDIYVAVGKNDLHVLKWVLDHAISPGTRVFLVHVFCPINYIPTPVGRLSRSQLSQEQLQVYVNEESNRRSHLLAKYIRLCNDSRVPADTMLLESNTAAKAILDLIPIANITKLVMGSKRSPSTRLSRRGHGKGEYVKKNAPEYCEVTIICDGKEVLNGQVQGVRETVPSPLASPQEAGISRQSERNFFECVCFSGKFT